MEDKEIRIKVTRLELIRDKMLTVSNMLVDNESVPDLISAIQNEHNCPMEQAFLLYEQDLETQLTISAAIIDKTINKLNT